MYTKINNQLKLPNIFLKGKESDLLKIFPQGQFSVVIEDDQFYICSAPSCLVYVFIETMNRVYIYSFAKIMMNGLKYLKKMAGRFLLSLPVEVVLGNLCFVLILTYINNWWFIQHKMVLAWKILQTAFGTTKLVVISLLFQNIKKSCNDAYFIN